MLHIQPQTLNGSSLLRGRALLAGIVAMLLAVSMFAATFASSHAPSTNDANRDAGWAYVDVESENGEATLTFNSTRGFASCFEYRTDGDESQKIGETNYNPAFEGLYPFVCVNNESKSVNVPADEYVEVRLAFGAEKDERFDWTRFEVEQPAVPVHKDDCKKGGYEAFGFKNQGQCVSFVQANERASFKRN